MRIVALALLFLTACQPKASDPVPQRLEIERPLMGTLFRVVTYTTDLPTARNLIHEAFTKAADLETAATDYNPTSELSQLTQKPPHTPIPVSDTLFPLLQLAHDLATQTHGAYDPTLGPLTQLWRTSLRTHQLPSPETLADAKKRTGYQHLILNQKNQTATLTQPGMQLDLGGIAKGYAADLIFDHLAQAGLTQTLVVAGGDLRLGDAPPEKDGWDIGLRTFHLTPSSTLALENCAVSTSGDLHQHLTIDGTRYAHIIDPQTGLGLTQQKAASVIAPLAQLTDPLATAACTHPDPQSLLTQFPQASFRILSENKNARPIKSGRFEKE
ncbi:MAG: FAD:protein FMN transferase [Verrucomicrobiaceae bacterium]